MKKTTKKSPPKASHKKAIKDLPVKGLQAARAESVKGGTYTKQKPDGSANGNVAAKWNVAQGAAA